MGTGPVKTKFQPRVINHFGLNRIDWGSRGSKSVTSKPVVASVGYLNSADPRPPVHSCRQTLTSATIGKASRVREFPWKRASTPTRGYYASSLHKRVPLPALLIRRSWSITFITVYVTTCLLSALFRCFKVSFIHHFSSRLFAKRLNFRPSSE